MDTRKLLTRTEFREQVFARDNHKCVFCDKPAVDAHHILERRLWSDSGYYIDNGCSVCQFHHLQCEMTLISVEDIRITCHIAKPIIPEHLYDDLTYDKWGNVIQPTGQRLKGELFFDESVQKILERGKVLEFFTDYVKYPRTYHLPWSQSIGKDDRILPNMDHFQGKRVIATIKMDGENTTMYNNYIHARSIDGRTHPSRNWVKQFWSTISADIPQQWRICGENLYAEHSIPYSELLSYFMGFSMWTNRNVSLSWDDTLEWFAMLNIVPVPILYDGIYDEQIIKKLGDGLNLNNEEGYVVRIADQFDYAKFRFSVAKFVRKNHIQTTKHWFFHSPIKVNKLKC